MAVKPHEVVGEELTGEDLAIISRWEEWIDYRLLELRHDRSTLEGRRTFSLWLGRLPPALKRHLGRLPACLLPELLARYAAVGWEVDYRPRRRKIGRQSVYVEHQVLFTAPVVKQLPAPAVSARPRPQTGAVPPDEKSGYVYLLEAENGLYKIGRSKHPRFRIAELTKAVAPFQIKAIHTAWYPDCHKAERELHIQFSEQRRRGEWFALTAADVKAVIEHAYSPA